MQADSPVSRNKSPLELETIRNLGYVSCRVFLTIETSLYTQVEHTQVDRAEAQFKLKTIIARNVKQTEMKMMQGDTMICLTEVRIHPVHPRVNPTLC